MSMLLAFGKNEKEIINELEKKGIDIKEYDNIILTKEGNFTNKGYWNDFDIKEMLNRGITLCSESFLFQNKLMNKEEFENCYKNGISIVKQNLYLKLIVY